MDDKYNFLGEDLLELDGIEECRKTKWNHYSHEDFGVPRVTHILKQCRDQSGLIDWAAKVGYKSNYYRDKALAVGSYVHEMIDVYLEDKYIKRTDTADYRFDLSGAEPAHCNEISNALTNFLSWEKQLNNNGGHIDEIIGIEVPISCPWFGGTVDAIIRINSAIYIIDFKTSKSISYEYLLQTAAYMWCINMGYTNLPHIDGIGIIRVDKSKLNSFEDLFLNLFNPYQQHIIEEYWKCFCSYVEAYYRTSSTDFITDKYVSNYNGIKGVL